MKLWTEGECVWLIFPSKIQIGVRSCPLFNLSTSSSSPVTRSASRDPIFILLKVNSKPTAVTQRGYAIYSCALASESSCVRKRCSARTQLICIRPREMKFLLISSHNSRTRISARRKTNKHTTYTPERAYQRSQLPDFNYRSFLGSARPATQKKTRTRLSTAPSSSQMCCFWENKW